MDDAVDVVVAGHTHSRLNLEVDGKLVVEALSYGVAFDRVRLTVDRASGDVVAKSADVLSTGHAASLPTRACGRWSPTTRAGWLRSASASWATLPQPLDDGAVDRLAVEAQRAFAGADVAVLNSGNTRAALDAGPVTYADAFEVHAYEHPVWRFRMSGAELGRALAEHTRRCWCQGRGSSTPRPSTRWPPTGSWPTASRLPAASTGRSSARTCRHWSRGSSAGAAEAPAAPVTPAPAA